MASSLMAKVQPSLLKSEEAPQPIGQRKPNVNRSLTPAQIAAKNVEMNPLNAPKAAKKPKADRGTSASIINGYRSGVNKFDKSTRYFQ